MPSATRAFIVRNTRLQSLPNVQDLKLYLADDVMALWQITNREFGCDDLPPPYWAAAWAGGQALARYVLEHPDEVTGKHVLDFAAGSGLCAIAAMKAGAHDAVTADIDPLCVDAIEINAQANAVALSHCSIDLLDTDPPAVDLILAGDIWYEKVLATRALPWLMSASASGIRILNGDPGRSYFPLEHFVRLAEYEVKTTRALEGVNTKRVGVYALRDTRCRLCK